MTKFKYSRMATLLVIGCLACVQAHAQQQPAQQAQPPSIAPPPEHPAIEPAAIEMLKATGARLAAAKSMSFTATTTYEAPARNGQPLYYATLSQVSVLRPNKLRVITPGDGPASDIYYDGKSLVVYSPAAGLVATADAPPTIEGAVKEAFEKAAIYFPFTEVIVADPYKALAENLASAFVVGQSHVVGGIVTDMVAITNDNVQAEIWIGIDDGLPRMIRAVYPKDPTKARYEVQFSNWKLNPVLKDADFISVEALRAPRMALMSPDAVSLAKP